VVLEELEVGLGAVVGRQELLLGRGQEGGGLDFCAEVRTGSTAGLGSLVPLHTRSWVLTWEPSSMVCRVKSKSGMGFLNLTARMALSKGCGSGERVGSGASEGGWRSSMVTGGWREEGEKGEWKKVWGCWWFGRRGERLKRAVGRWWLGGGGGGGGGGWGWGGGGGGGPREVACAAGGGTQMRCRPVLPSAAGYRDRSGTPCRAPKVLSLILDSLWHYSRSRNDWIQKCA
jgi:hypothetical protein